VVRSSTSSVITARLAGLGHGAIRDLLKRELGLGHGDANTLTTFYLKSAVSPTPPPPPAADGDALASIYRGAKAPLRPLHEALMAAISDVGPFELALKKDYVSLRRKKQFAMIGPATQTRVEVGLNMKDVAPTPRMIAPLHLKSGTYERT
jgi:Domain of unknown function (DUF5655)